MRRTRTFSSWVRCGPSPVSTLIASATGPWPTTQPMYDRSAGSSMLPSACIGRTVAGIRPFEVEGHDSSNLRHHPCGRIILDNRSKEAPMTQLDIFSLDGRVALVPGGGGAIGSAHRRGVRGRRGEGGRGRSHARERSTRRSSGSGRRAREGVAVAADATDEADCGRMVAGDPRAVRPDRHRGQRGRRRRRQGAPPGRGLSARRLGLDHGAQRAEHDRPDAGGRRAR